MGYNDNVSEWENKNTSQNMTMNRPYIAPFLTSLAPIDSPPSQLSNGATLFQNGATKDRFVDMFFVAHWGSSS